MANEIDTLTATHTVEWPSCSKNVTPSGTSGAPTGRTARYTPHAAWPLWAVLTYANLEALFRRRRVCFAPVPASELISFCMPSCLPACRSAEDEVHRTWPRRPGDWDARVGSSNLSVCLSLSLSLSLSVCVCVSLSFMQPSSAISSSHRPPNPNPRAKHVCLTARLH